MPPVEKYIPNKQAGESQQPRHFNVLDSTPNTEHLDKDAGFLKERKALLERINRNYSIKREQAIYNARLSVSGKQNAEQKPDLEIDKEREFSEELGFQNWLLYRKEGGWRDKYMNGVDENGNRIKEMMSIEQFVLSQQYAKLESARNLRMEARIGQSIGQIYDELQGEDKKDARVQKSKNVFESSSKYFEENRDKIEASFDAKGVEKQKLQADLLDGFRTNVFADLKEKFSTNPNTLDQVNGLFDELMDDYKNMIATKGFLSDHNNEIVANMADDEMTEEKWLEFLAKKAEEEEKKIKEKEKQVQQAQTVVSSGSPSSFSMSEFGFSDISAVEKLPSDSKILIEQIEPGIYKVKFPAKSGEGQESRFRVRNIVDDSGRSRNVFVFQDQLMDGPAVVEDIDFTAQINRLYLDHVMGESVKEGRDYVGPGLNGIIPDKQMFDLAKKLFAHKNIEKVPMDSDDAIIFSKLMLIIAGKSNNSSGKGDYGDLLAIQNRIRMMEFVLGLDTGDKKASRCYDLLKRKTPDEAKSLSVDSLCRALSIPPNHGSI